MKISFYLITFLLIISCKDCKKEVIIPSKIVALNDKQINSLTQTSFIVSKIKGSSEIIEKLKFLKGKDFQFKKDGMIFSNNIKIGEWKNDRWIKLKAVDQKFLINIISKVEMRIYSKYFDCKTESIIDESIYLTGNYDTMPEFDLGVDF